MTVYIFMLYFYRYW